MGPCYNCTKRTLKCHSKCEAYLSWKKEIDKVSEKRKAIQHFYKIRGRSRI